MEDFMKKLQLWKEQVKNLQKRIDEQLSLDNWKFIQGIENGELPETDASKWDEKKNPVNWSMKSGTVYFRNLFTLPPDIEGIPTENSNINLTFLFPSGVELFIDGEKVYAHKYWADKIATPFPLMQKAKRGEKHLIVFKTPQGDGYGTFWAKLSIDSAEDLLFELNSIFYQLKFVCKLAEQNNHLKKYAQKALKVLNPRDIENRNWNKVLGDIKKAEEILEVFIRYA